MRAVSVLAHPSHVGTCIWLSYIFVLQHTYVRVGMCDISLVTYLAVRKKFMTFIKSNIFETPILRYIK